MSSSSASLKSRAHTHDSDAGDIPLIPLNPTYPANPTLKLLLFCARVVDRSVHKGKMPTMTPVRNAH